MLTARTFLVRGLLAGLAAGILAFGVAYLVGEPPVAAAIALEDQGAVEAVQPDDHPDHAADAGHTHGDGDDAIVSRQNQATWGLLTATLLFGTALGGIVGVAGAFAAGRLGAISARASTAVVAAIAAIVAARRLTPRLGAWNSWLIAAGGYLVVVLIAGWLLPIVDEVPADFSADLLWRFRTASLTVQATLWAAIGLALATMIGIVVRRDSEKARGAGQLAGTVA